MPPIFGFRSDCTYGKLAAVRLPEDVQGLSMCEVNKLPLPIAGAGRFSGSPPPEAVTVTVTDPRSSSLVQQQYTLDRGIVHACHAGGVVHFLEGWTHHEVGAIDVDRIDIVWEAALRHGLRPA